MTASPHELEQSGSRAERKERTRQRLLDATLNLVADRSLASVSMRGAARDAGIVPTAFYRHFASMEALGVELVDESARPLRRLIRDARTRHNPDGDVITDTVHIVAEHVRTYPQYYRFLSRERFGGIRTVRKAISDAIRSFVSDLTVDLSRMVNGSWWTHEDLQMTAELMVSVMFGAVMELLAADTRHPEDATVVLERAERQLRIIALGMQAWRSSEQRVVASDFDRPSTAISSVGSA